MSTLSPATGLSGIPVYQPSFYSSDQVDAKIGAIQASIATVNKDLAAIQLFVTNFRSKDIEDLVNANLKTALETEIGDLKAATNTALRLKADSSALTVLSTKLDNASTNIITTLTSTTGSALKETRARTERMERTERTEARGQQARTELTESLARTGSTESRARTELTESRARTELTESLASRTRTALMESQGRR